MYFRYSNQLLPIRQAHQEVLHHQTRLATSSRRVPIRLKSFFGADLMSLHFFCVRFPDKGYGGSTYTTICNVLIFEDSTLGALLVMANSAHVGSTEQAFHMMTNDIR